MSDFSESDLVAVGGRKAVQELLRHRARHCQKLLVQEKLVLPAALQSLIRETGVAQEVVTREALDEFDSGHQGVVLLIKPAEAVELSVLIERSLARTKRIVVLDCLMDPQNVGAIFRATEAFGFDGVVVTTDRSAPITQTVRKVSRGSSELLTLCKVKNLSRSLEELKRAGFWIVGTGLDEEAQPLYRVDLPEPIAVVFGSEGAGMRELTRKSCDLVVSIPLLGSMQSLNVSQAASVVLAEIVRVGGSK